jgi:DNA-binding transcriptional regulator PaaX
MNATREKMLLLLLGGLVFGYSVAQGKQRMVLKTISREWAKIDRQELNEGIKYLYKLGYIDKEKSAGGFVSLALTKKGKLKTLDRQLMAIKNKKEKWDGKWRVVAFDIPEKYKRGRDALRRKLKTIGFCELQKSVFITPFNCKKEIALLVNFFELDKFVRFGVLESVDNENHFKKVFNLK